MALSNNPTVEELKELAALHPDIEVTRLNSLMAGNCEEGTDDFIKEYFEGQTSVKVSQLVQYFDGFPGVRSVLDRYQADGCNCYEGDHADLACAGMRVEICWACRINHVS